MIFTVERPHVDFMPPRRHVRSVQWALIDEPPLRLEVDEERRGRYPSPCECEKVYRVTPNGVRWLITRGLLKHGLSVSRRPCVCACMGTLSN